MVRKLVLSLIAILGMFASLEAQNRQVSGTVIGSDGQPIVGATVIVVGTKNGTTTNPEGAFTIAAPVNGTLSVSFVGYETKTVAIAGKTKIAIELAEDTHAIDDVIVTAFGTAKKEAFTGSAKVIKSDDLIKTQSSNVEDALVGKVAGVQFSSASGRLGAGQTITVRGIGSFSAGNEPLWVVDGVPYSGDKNNINPADIESISILKDAASNALYGARGANGVIMVTTKRAKAGEATVTFDGKWGINTRALQNYDIVKDPGEYYEMHYKALRNYNQWEGNMTAAEAHDAALNLMFSTNPGGLGYNVYTVPAGQDLIGTNGRLNPAATLGRTVNWGGKDYLLTPDNWLDEFYKTATFRQEYNVTVTGATDRSNFYASLGYLDNTGIIDGSNMNRLTARLRGDYQAKKWLKVGGNFSYTHFVWNNGNRTSEEGESGGGNVFATAIKTAPIYPLYMRNADGSIMIDQYGMKMYDPGDGRNAGQLRPTGGQSNPLQDIQLNKNISEGNAFSASGFFDFDIYKGLKFTANANVTIDETRSTMLLNAFYGQFATSGGSISKSHSRQIDYNLQQLLSYNATFADKHHIDLLLGHEMSNEKSYGLGANRTVLFSPDNLELSGAVVDGSSSSSSVGEYNNEGFFFRGQYDFDERVFVSGSYRRDASSMFHPDHRWGNFWSLGAAWLINKESWFNADWVSMLKVKASYGSQGNDGLPYANLYTDVYDIANDGNNHVTTIFSRKGNPNITWETNSNLNVGVEFGLWNDRLTGSIDFFNRKTTDMLFRLPVPLEAGYTSIYTNFGDMLNRGIEIDLQADLIRTKNLVWSANLNMTHYKNKLVKLPEEYKNHTSADGKYKGRQSGSRFYTEGKSVYEFYIPTYAGVNPETGVSMWYIYEDKEVVDPETGETSTVKERTTTESYTKASEKGREFQGSGLADLYGGFGTSLNYKGLDFSIAFTYQLGGQALDSGYMTYMSNPSSNMVGFNYHRDLLKGWSPENKDTNNPRFAYGDLYANATSDRFLIDASYLNIQNITLGYTLPRKWTRKFLVDKLRIYVGCDNVWYWSKRKGLDPRQSIGGSTNPYYYAPIRTFSGGVTVTF